MFDTFAAGRALLQQDPAQAESRDHLKALLERDDRNTIHVFGGYADVYHIRHAVEDGAIRPLYYESRIVRR